MLYGPGMWFKGGVETIIKGHVAASIGRACQDRTGGADTLVGLRLSFNTKREKVRSRSLTLIGLKVGSAMPCDRFPAVVSRACKVSFESHRLSVLAVYALPPQRISGNVQPSISAQISSPAMSEREV